MKKSTLTKLDNAALKIADALLAHQRAGLLCKDPNDDKFTRYDSIKKSISISKAPLSCLCGFNLSNVLKTTRQYNYLTNEILHRLRTHNFFSKDSMEKVTTHNYVQGTFDFS